LSEALAFSLSERHGIKTTAIRSAGIYGARDHNMMPYFRWLMRLPLLPVPTFRFPFVHAGDVADAAVGALRNDASAGKAYLIAGRPDTVYDFFKAFKQASGSWGLVVPLPLPTGVRIDCTAAERELGFHNKSYVDGLHECFESDAKYAAMKTLPRNEPKALRAET
jgi:nucleoside-diphosphate-sugar epimerase